MQCVANPDRQREVTAMLEEIKAWLIEEGWSVRQERPVGMAWSLVATSRQQVLVNLQQRSDHPDQVLIFAILQLEEATCDQIMQLPMAERRELLWDVRFRLLQLGVEFDGITEPPQRVTVGLAIYRDGLGKDNLLRRMTQVHNATLAAAWTFARKFAEPPPERTMGLIHAEPPK
jgi:hypothetical protein